MMQVLLLVLVRLSGTMGCEGEVIGAVLEIRRWDTAGWTVQKENNRSQPLASANPVEEEEDFGRRR